MPSQLDRIILSFPTLLDADEAGTPGRKSWVQLAKTGTFVSNRYGEFTISKADLALGASTGAMLGRIFGQGLLLASAGAAIGIGAAFALGRVIQGATLWRATGRSADYRRGGVGAPGQCCRCDVPARSARGQAGSSGRPALKVSDDAGVSDQRQADRWPAATTKLAPVRRGWSWAAPCRRSCPEAAPSPPGRTRRPPARN